jgi:hypothetical protein
LALVLVGVLLLVACTATDGAGKAAAPVPLPVALREVANQRLGSVVQSVTVEQHEQGTEWAVQVRLASAVPTDTLDSAAASMLAATASALASDAPISVSFLGKDLRPSWSSAERWGELQYDWGAGAGSPDPPGKRTRGSVVYLWHRDAPDPQPSKYLYSTLYTSKPRGVWEKVDVSRLSELAARPIEPVIAAASVLTAVHTAVPTFKGTSQDFSSGVSTDSLSVVEYGSPRVPGRVVKLHKGASGLWYVDSVVVPNGGAGG